MIKINIDQSFYFVLVRGPDGAYSVEIDNPTDRAYVFALVREHDGDVITVSEFNTVEGWANNVTEDFAREWFGQLSYSDEMPKFVEENITATEAEDFRSKRSADRWGGAFNPVERWAAKELAS